MLFVQEQFFPPATFSRYNMFNHHFFEGEGAKSRYLEFLTEGCDERVAVVTDPPFGGMVDVLAHNLKKVETDWKMCNQG